MTRRQLLQGLLSAVWSAAAWVQRSTAGVRAAGTVLVPAAAAPAAPAASQPALVGEADVLAAFAEVLVDGRLFAADTRRDLIEHLTESAAEDRDRLALYQTTARLLDRMAGGRFAQMALADRIALVARHRLGIRLLTAEESAGAISDDVRDVRTRVVPDLIGACWRSPDGWHAVGYSAFPGRCGDLTRYTRAEP